MDIIFFAAIALIIILKLREQLGKISDEEKDLITKKVSEKRKKIAKLQNNIINQVKNAVEEEVSKATQESKLISQLSQENQQIFLQIINKCQITTQTFLDGAKSAFEMVLKAFATNDKDTLNFLLSDKIYQGFEKSIDQRQKDKKTLNTNLISIEKTEIMSCQIMQNHAFITLKITSKQINYIIDKDNKITEGSKSEIATLNDIWTFKKDLNDKNPNWKVSATG